MGWGIDSKRFDQRTQTFTISTKRKVSIRRRDQVVAFARLPNEVRLLWLATAEDVKPIESDGKTLIRVSARTEFEPARQATDYAYSLPKVYNFEQPWVHFRRQYVYLDDFDIETLSRGRIFWSRTIVGHLANALPEPRLLALLSKMTPALAHQGEGPRGSALLWKYVSSFIDDEYLRPAELLHGTVEGLRKLAEDTDAVLPVEDLAVGDERETLGTLAEQAHRFDAMTQAFRAGMEDSLLRRLDVQVQEHLGDDQDFVERFGEAAWPLKIRLT